MKNSLSTVQNALTGVKDADFPSTIKRVFGGNKDVVLYGAGVLGHSMARLLTDFNYNVICFLDRNAKEIGSADDDIPVYEPNTPKLDDEFRGKNTVAFSLNMQSGDYDDVEAYLRGLGWRTIINAGPLCRLAFEIHSFNQSINLIKTVLTDESDDVFAAFELMSDEHSADIFARLLRAHAALDYDMPELSQGMTQYFDVNVPFRFNYGNFVDCGAFVGDTLEVLAKKRDSFKYFGFEPDVDNYAKLIAVARRIRSDSASVLCLPIAVSARSEKLRFSGESSSSGKFVESGGEIIQAVSLDDMFHGYADLMIKMDIEGAETDALNGARRIITETAPDLAICLYHKVTDLWRIPLLLKNFRDDYRFYLRSHSAYGLETVLYATIA